MAGGMLLYHPIIDEGNYRIHDEAFRMRCCTSESPDLCESYFSRRPSNDGSRYQSPVVGVFVVIIELFFWLKFNK